MSDLKTEQRCPLLVNWPSGGPDMQCTRRKHTEGMHEHSNKDAEIWFWCKRAEQAEAKEANRKKNMKGLQKAFDDVAEERDALRAQLTKNEGECWELLNVRDNDVDALEQRIADLEESEAKRTGQISEALCARIAELNGALMDARCSLCECLYSDPACEGVRHIAAEALLARPEATSAQDQAKP